MSQHLYCAFLCYHNGSIFTVQYTEKLSNLEDCRYIFHGWINVDVGSELMLLFYNSLMVFIKLCVYLYKIRPVQYPDRTCILYNENWLGIVAQKMSFTCTCLILAVP